MGGVRRFRVWDADPRRSAGKSARRFAAASSARPRSAGRRWCRSSRRAKTTAPRWSRRWPGSFASDFGAPDLAAARAAAEEEVAFAASLCDHPPDTLIAVHRSFENGEIREAFRTLRPRGGTQADAGLRFLEVEGEEEPGENVDLAALAKAGPKD